MALGACWHGPIKEAIAAAVGCRFPAEVGKLLEELEGLEGLRLRKRQPIKEAIAAAVGCKRPARDFKRFKGLKPGKRQA